jgi:hypothetical protein
MLSEAKKFGVPMLWLPKFGMQAVGDLLAGSGGHLTYGSGGHLKFCSGPDCYVCESGTMQDSYIVTLPDEVHTLHWWMYGGDYVVTRISPGCTFQYQFPDMYDPTKKMNYWLTLSFAPYLVWVMLGNGSLPGELEWTTGSYNTLPRMDCSNLGDFEIPSRYGTVPSAYVSSP